MIQENDPPADPSAASGATVAAIEPIVLQLRIAFQASGQTPIEKLVGQAPGEIQPELAKALVAEDFLLRQRAGQQPKLEEYLHRLPAYRDAIEQAWDSIQQKMLRPTTDLDGTPAGSLATHDDPDTPAYFGSYRVLKRLGAGAFGSVYQAQHQETESIVAIKVLKPKWANDPQCGKEMREQFAAEAQTMLKFDHPNIVRVISLDDQADPPYFVQEFIDGQTLRDRLRQGRPELTEALRYAIQIADALAHMHSREKWHRDLKPENILLDNSDNLFVADFGLVLDNAQRWSLKGQTAGTRAYMAPEQIRGRTHLLNARCDLWAFGVVLYELLVGRRPFDGEGDQLVTEILDRTPPAPRELNSSIPRRVNRLCMQCLAKRDADRPDAAADIADDLREELQKLTSESAKFDSPISSGSSVPQAASSSATAPVSGDVPSDTDPGSADSAKSDASPVEYPIPTLRKFTTEQASLYLRLMPRSYSNPDELPELIAYWKQRIEERDPLRTFRVGILVGVSGCGKSSLLEAGLVPQLADHVVPILLEASDKDTEQRILVRLRRAFPEADPQGAWKLPDWMFRLRSSDLLSDGGKVVIILDQFEQWLNAHGGEPTNELLEALEQCDGQRLQAIVCVRDGFHASLVRFVQKLGIQLDENDNYTTAHRFTPDHAGFVLEQFGRGLKRIDDPISEEQRLFISAAVDGLDESGVGIVCVRLVVFAFVMQDRPWTTNELAKLGGLDGIGSQFLTDIFEGRTVSERYRRYLPAAMRILSDLLPGEGTEIKEVRSYTQLKAVSHLSVNEFDDLLMALTRKLFLVTSVESAAESHETPPKDPQQGISGMYQLTHDFLVPAIRGWLYEKEGETRNGRARLKLIERSKAWRAKREKKQLPTMLETLSIRWRTDASRWKPEQREMMHVAVRHHLAVCGTVATALAITLLSLYSWTVFERLSNQKEKLQIAMNSLVADTGDSIPGRLEILGEFSKPVVLPKLRAMFLNEQDQKKRLALAFGLASLGEPPIEFLVQEINEELDPSDNANMLAALQNNAHETTTSLTAAAGQCSNKKDWTRKAKLAVVALSLGDTSLASDMCEYVNRSDPEQRTLFINELPKWQLDVKALAELVSGEESSALRSGLCMGIGSRTPNSITAEERSIWIAQASKWFIEAADSSTHSAAGWLLRHWGYPEPEVENPEKEAQARDWFVNSLGMTFVRIKPPDFDEKLDNLPDPLDSDRDYLLQLGALNEKELQQPDVRSARAVANYNLGNYEAALIDFEWLNADLNDFERFIEYPQIDRGQILVYHVLTLIRLNRMAGAMKIYEAIDQRSLSKANKHYIEILMPALSGNAVQAVERATMSMSQNLSAIEYYDIACATAVGAEESKELDPRSSKILRSLALKSIETAIAKGNLGYNDIVAGPDLVSLRDEPTFRSVMRRYMEAGSNHKEYWMMDREVSQQQYEIFLDDIADKLSEEVDEWRRYEFPSATNPVDSSSWEDAVRFCNWLSAREGLMPFYRKTGQTLMTLSQQWDNELKSFRELNVEKWEIDESANGYRLPSQREWEYACRAGTTTLFSTGDDETLLKDYATVYPAKSTQPVGSKFPNSWGIHDLHGNVSEWCGSQDAASVHGGSWSNTPPYCGSGFASPRRPYGSQARVGFRIVCNSFLPRPK